MPAIAAVDPIAVYSLDNLGVAGQHDGPEAIQRVHNIDTAAISRWMTNATWNVALADLTASRPTVTENSAVDRATIAGH